MTSLEQRWGRRISTDVAVRFVALPATIGAGRVTNVSLTGAFLETRSDLRLTSVIHLQNIGAHPSRRRLVASVVRRGCNGVGLQWCECASNATLLAHFDAWPVPSASYENDKAVYCYQFDFVD